ncbi:DUF4236 domain-containing protein (plasmid) [Caballeronia sp. NK8]|uniref:DUF4236 domain-containing protein n=1 Tax=Caballeronia sp. NK8 TaxID=140098 RepID=UPI001BB4BB2A|nr:DUF4236 domain-containing protein [Caballeronia sp. NK8]BCQ27196.1 DUF4236 domain-containing protein [Caballeronia sp. NK8]
MGWSFRKSFKLLPGVRVNLSKSGTSYSFGGKGVTYNSKGRVSTSIPGTGLRYTSKVTPSEVKSQVGLGILFAILMFPFMVVATLLTSGGRSKRRR